MRVGFLCVYQTPHQMPFVYNLVSPSQSLKGGYLWEAASTVAPVIPSPTAWQSCPFVILAL